MAKKRKAWLKKLLGLSLALAMTIQPLPAAFGGMGVVSAAEAIEQEVTVEQAVTEAYGIMKNTDGTLTVYAQSASAPNVWIGFNKDNPVLGDLPGYGAMPTAPELGENYYSYTTAVVADSDIVHYFINYTPVSGGGAVETGVITVAVADIAANGEQPGSGEEQPTTPSKYINLEEKNNEKDGIHSWVGTDVSDATFTYVGESVICKATTGWGQQDWWSVQWTVQDIAVTAGDVIVEYDIVSTIDKPVLCKLTNFGEGQDQDSPIVEDKYELTADSAKHCTMNATIAADGKVRLFFNLAGGTGEGTVTISNVRVYKDSPYINLEEKSNEKDGIHSWVGTDVSDATFAYDGESVICTATTGWGQQDWWSVQWTVQDIDVTAGDWVVEYDIVSNIANKPVLCKLTNFGEGQDQDSPIVEDKYELTADSAKHCTMNATIAADGKVRLFFNLAGGTGEGTVTISNIKFTKAPIKEAPAVAPTQKSDKKNGFKVGDAVVLNATDAAAWANAITSVVVNNKTVAAENYTVNAEAGTVTIAADVFTKQNVYKIEIAAEGYGVATITVPVYDTEVVNEEWTKVWADEFDGDSLDENNWSYEIGVKSGDDTDSSNGAPIYWGNDEKEYYTKESVEVKDGYLVITGDKLTDEVKAQYGITDGFVQYSSGRIRTITDEGKVLAGTTYGRVEAKMSMPAEAGYWPAFWMLPTTETIGVYGGWPASGELDIMEAVGQNPGKVDGTIHYGGSDWTKHVYSGGNYYFTDGSDISEEHVYAVEWEPGEIRWYVDDVLYHIENNWYGADATGQNYSYPAPYDEEFYILFNLAMSGNYVSNVDPTVMGGQMKVDYVRILMEENTDYDAEVNAPAAIEKDTEFFEANKGYTDLIVDKDYTTLPDNKYGDGGMLLPGNEIWWSSVNDGAGAAGTVDVTVEGVAKIDVTATGANDYNVQLIQNIPLAQGYTYRVTFDAWTDVAAGRTIRVAPGGDCNHGWTSYSTGITAELSKKAQTFTFDFTMANESDPSARFEMNLGASTGTVYIDNVSVIALTDDQIKEDAEAKESGPKEPLANGEYIYNGTFDKGTGKLGYWTMEGTEGSTADRNYTVTVGAEDTKLIQTGLKLTEYDDYKLTFDASTLGAGKVRVALTDETGEFGYVATEFDLTADAKTYELSFTVPEGNGTDMGNLTFTFIGEGETVTIDNVTMARLTNAGVAWDEYEIYPMGEGTDALTGWTTYDEVWNWAELPIAAKDLGNNEVGFEVATVPQSQAYMVMLQKGDIALAKGMTYKIKYAVKASAENQPVSISLEDSSYVRAYEKDITVGTEWTYVEDTITPEAMATRAIKFMFGAATEECTMYVKDVSIELDAPKPQFVEGKEISEMMVDDTAKLEFEHDRKVMDKYDAFTYSTVDSDLVEIDAEGNVKALAAGIATVVVTSGTGSKYTFTITVIDEELEAAKADLAAEIAACEEIDEAEYTAESWKVLADAIAEGKELPKKNRLTIAEVNEAIEAIKDAKEALVDVLTAAKEALAAEIAAIDEIDEADYTAESWKAYADAVAAGKEVAEDATVDEINAAIKAIRDAKAALENVLEIAKAALAAEIAAIDELDEADYTAESWKAYADAVAVGKEVAEDATVDVINAAVKAIQDAKAALKEAPAAPEPVENPFGDVNEGQWFYKYVMFAYKNGVMTGKGKMEDGTDKDKFDPSNSITRAEFVQMLYAKENTPAVEYKDTFADVPEGKWFTNAILWANENGIVSGKGEGLFDVNGKITRQEIAVILNKYAAYKQYDVTVAEDTDLSSFLDDETVANWGLDAIKWAVQNGVITGKGNAKDGYSLAPNGDAIRAEAATMLSSFMETFEGAIVE